MKIKKIIFATISLILLSLIINFSKQILHLYRVNLTLEKRQEDLKILKERNLELTEKLKAIKEGRGGNVSFLPNPSKEVFKKNPQEGELIWKKWWRAFFD